MNRAVVAVGSRFAESSLHLDSQISTGSGRGRRGVIGIERVRMEKRLEGEADVLTIFFAACGDCEQSGPAGDGEVTCHGNRPACIRVNEPVRKKARWSWRQSIEGTHGQSLNDSAAVTDGRIEQTCDQLLHEPAAACDAAHTAMRIIRFYKIVTIRRTQPEGSSDAEIEVVIFLS